MGLTASSFARVEKTNEYESSLTTAGFMKITATPDGTTYELTEHGRRFLREYAFLNRESIMASSVIDGNSSTSETIAE